MAETGVDWIIRANLEDRLRDWAREYSGPIVIGRQGRHILARLIEFGGYLPGVVNPRNVVARTAADDIEDIVRRMERVFPWNAAILRTDYFWPDSAMDTRLGFLRGEGIAVSRTQYFDRLAQAKQFVAGALVGSDTIKP